MGFRFLYEFVTPAGRTDALLEALVPHVSQADAVRLRAALPWRPERCRDHVWRDRQPVRLRQGIAGLAAADDSANSYCLGFLFESDEEIEGYDGNASRQACGRLRRESGRVCIGCVWVSLVAGDTLCVLEAAAATTGMSILFQQSASVRRTFHTIARASGALALFFDSERERVALCAPARRLVLRPDSEPYELEELGDVHVDAYYGALLERAGPPR